ncbi:MAG: hypothetical protein ACLFUU_10420 [Desulfobacteraceae bacterium]
MKIRKMAVLVLVVFSLVAAAVAAQAAETWYTCTVKWAGPQINPYKVRIHLTRSVGTPGFTKTCVAPVGREKEMLAVALTAISSNKPVLVLIDESQTIPLIKGIRLRAY